MCISMCYKLGLCIVKYLTSHAHSCLSRDGCVRRRWNAGARSFLLSSLLFFSQWIWKIDREVLYSLPYANFSHACALVSSLPRLLLLFLHALLLIPTFHIAELAHAVFLSLQNFIAGFFANSSWFCALVVAFSIALSIVVLYLALNPRSRRDLSCQFYLTKIQLKSDMKSTKTT